MKLFKKQNKQELDKNYNIYMELKNPIKYKILERPNLRRSTKKNLRLILENS